MARPEQPQRRDRAVPRRAVRPAPPPVRRSHGRPRAGVTGIVGAVVTAIATLVAAPVASASADGPYGFYFGSDSNGPNASGSYPYRAPGTGGLFASYGGEIGTWTNWRGCTRGEALSLSDLNAVNANESYDPHIPGVSFYWFMAGPGADPSYNGSVAEAYRWGVAQAARVQSDYANMSAHGIVTATRRIPMMYMDIEGQPTPGYANGWNERVNSCGQIARTEVIPVQADRATFNGFYDYIHLDTIFHPGVYSTPDFWYQTFGTGPAASIPNTYEWTPVTSTGNVYPRPFGFSQAGSTATWFGNISTARQAGWQWTQYGGDWDQMDSFHLP